MGSSNKEERSEGVYIYVTPSIKRDFELAKDNKELQETIIKSFLQSEKEWLNQELKCIDESTIKYSARLLGIKESFSKCQDAYITEIEALYKTAENTLSKLNSVVESTNISINRTQLNLAAVLNQAQKVDFYKIEKMLDLLNKVNSMGDSELALLKKMLDIK